MRDPVQQSSSTVGKSNPQCAVIVRDNQSRPFDTKQKKKAPLISPQGSKTMIWSYDSMIAWSHQQRRKNKDVVMMREERALTFLLLEMKSWSSIRAVHGEDGGDGGGPCTRGWEKLKNDYSWRRGVGPGAHHAFFRQRQKQHTTMRTLLLPVRYPTNLRWRFTFNHSLHYVWHTPPPLPLISHLPLLSQYDTHL